MSSENYTVDGTSGEKAGGGWSLALTPERQRHELDRRRQSLQTQPAGQTLLLRLGLIFQSESSPFLVAPVLTLDRSQGLF